MKIITNDRKTGRIKLTAESQDDLWYLSTIIDPKDICTGESEYKMKLSGATEKSKVARKRVWVELSVEKTEYEPERLRVSGTVVGGSEEVPRASHHSVDVTPGTTITLVKERWLDYHYEKLDQAKRSGNQKTLLVLFDREHALFFLLTAHGYEQLLELSGDVPKKGIDETKTGSFYADICAKIADYKDRHHIKTVIAASPSFWKEYLKKEMSDELAKNVIFSKASSVTASAIAEVLQRKDLQHALQGEQAAKEEEYVSNMMQALSVDKLAYGINDCSSALQEGNAKSLLVSEAHITKSRESGQFEQLENLMRTATDMNATVHVLSTHEAMQRLDGLGGVAVVKRW